MATTNKNKVLDFPLIFLGDKNKFKDMREGGPNITEATAKSRLMSYFPDKYPDTPEGHGAAVAALRACMLTPVNSDTVTGKKQPSINFRDVYLAMKDHLPIWSLVAPNGTRHLYFANKQNEVTKIEYVDDDSLVNSLMSQADLWDEVEAFYYGNEILEGHRERWDLRALLIKVINSHLLLDRYRLLPEQPKQISWDPSKFAFKQFDASTVVPGAYPTWSEFTKRLDHPDVFMAWIWGLFEPTNNIRQVMWLQGRGADGKSAVQKALTRYFGSKHVHSLSKGGEKQNWFHSGVYGKCLVNYSDCDEVHLINNPNIKQLTGGDLTSIEAKGVQAFSGQIYAKLFVTSNVTPKINPELEAHTSRLIRLRLSPPEAALRDVGFEDRLVAEMGHFLHDCREVYARFISTGSDTLILPDDLKKTIKDECSNENYYLLTEFENKYIEMLPGEVTKLSEITRVLKEFAGQEHNLSQMRQNFLLSDFETKMSAINVRLLHLPVDGTIVTVYQGIKLKELK